MYLIISASLNSKSRSRILAKQAEQHLQKMGKEVQFLDLRDTPLPFCDGEGSYGAENVSLISEAVRNAEGILVATPIYNYDVNAALKNFVELSSRAWTDKVVGFMCAAGGSGSYMSIMSLAASLMLDFRCLILPRFVYVTGESFREQELNDPDVEERLEDLVNTTIRIAEALQ